MKKFLFVATMIGVGTLLFSACHKEHGNFDPQRVNATSFYSQYGSNLQAFSGDASTGFVVTGERGTEITFPADAFVDGDGNVVAGQVDVGIIEILTKTDILLSGVATESNGQLLESGGELYIQALQNGDTLRLNPANLQWSNDPVRVKLPRDVNADPSGMILFDQGPRYDADLLDDDSYTWLVFDESPQALVGSYSYDFAIPSFGWINVDKFLGYPLNQLTYVHVKLTPGSAVGLQDVAMMMVFENLHSVIGLNYDPVADRFGTESFSLTPNIPIDEQIAVVVIAKDAQDNLYIAKQEHITVSANDVYSLTPQPANQADIDWLNNL